MAGRLVLGEYGALEEALWAEIEQARSGRPLGRLTVVAPSGRVVGHLKRAAARRFPAGLFGVQFANLFQLALDLAGESAGRFVPDPVVHEHLLLRWLESTPDALFGGPETRTWELAGAVHAAVRDLRDAAVDPAAGILLDALRVAAGAPGSRLTALDVRKLGAILDAHRAYAAALRRHGLADRAAVFRAAAAAAARSAAPVILFGFYDMTQVQADFVAELARTGSVSILVPHGADAATWRFGDWFRETWSPGVAGAVVRLPPPAPPPAPALATAVGERDEVWLAAKRIRALLDAGCPADAIAVVARSVEPYLPAVHALFREHHIPFDAPAARALHEEPIVQAALGLFRAGVDGFPRAAVLDVVCHPAFRAPGDRRHWPLLARVLRIARGDDWDRLARFVGTGVSRAMGREDDEGRRVRRIPARDVRGLVAALSRLRALRLPDAASWRALAAAHHAAATRSFAVTALSAEERRALAGLLDLVRTLGTLAGAEAVSRRIFVEAVEREARRRRLAVEPGGGVQVLDAMAARGLAFRHAFVLGLNARAFPRFIVEEPFVSDAVRREVIRVLGHHLPVRGDAYDEERLLFHLVVGCATESVVLVHQRADAAGRLRDPSPFLRPYLARGLVPDAVPRSERAKQARAHVRTPRELVLAAPDPERALAALGGDALAFRRARDAIRALEETAAPSAFEGRVGPLLPLPARFSATRLERYAACPFRYFAEQVLRLLPDDDRADDLTPREIGTLLHDTLERLYRGLAARALATADLGGEVAAAAAASAAAFEARTGIPLRGVLAVRAARVRRVVEQYAAWDLAARGAWEPVAFEVAGTATVAGLRLDGRLDRVDRHRVTGALRVVDYKRRWRSDWATGLDTLARRGQALQPPVYLEIARGLGSGPVEAAALHFVESFARETPEAGGEPGARFAVALTAAGWEACRADVEATLAGLVTLLRDGWFFLHVRDGRRGPCTSCDYRVVCRKNHPGVRDKPRATPEIAAHFPTGRVR